MTKLNTWTPSFSIWVHHLYRATCRSL